MRDKTYLHCPFCNNICRPQKPVYCAGISNIHWCEHCREKFYFKAWTTIAYASSKDDDIPLYEVSTDCESFADKYGLELKKWKQEKEPEEMDENYYSAQLHGVDNNCEARLNEK